MLRANRDGEYSNLMTRYPVLLFFVIFSFLPVILLGTGVNTWSLLFRISGLLGSKGNELIHLRDVTRDHSESRDAYFLK